MQGKIEGLASLLQGLSEHEIDAAVQLLQTLQTRRKADGQADTSAISSEQKDAQGVSVNEETAQTGICHVTETDGAATTASPAAPVVTFDSQALIVATSPPTGPTQRSEAATTSDQDELPLSALYAVDTRDGDEAVVVSTAESTSATPQSVAGSQSQRRRRRRGGGGSHTEAAHEPTTATTNTPPTEVVSGSVVVTTTDNETEDKAAPTATEGHNTGAAGSRKATTTRRTGSKAATPLAMHSLTSFGFQSCPVVSHAAEQNRLFPPFVQDRRIVPAALQFWNRRPEAETTNGTSEGPSTVAAATEAGDVAQPCIAVEDEDVSVVVDALPPRDVTTRQADKPTLPPQPLHYCDAEESSLMHPPLCIVEDSMSASVSVARPCTFDELIQASNLADTTTTTAREELCEKMHYSTFSLHTTLPAPYPGFDREVVFCGFFAIGYDPFQARPPYFGTYNHLQEGNLSAAELQQMARFPAGGAMPRLSALDYDYDSGDDWDVLENDDGIALSGSESGESDAAASASLSSSELDFINDEDDENDSDCELQRKMMEARERRLARLRGKDRLVPSFSGPFVGLSSSEHPLRAYDRLERLAPLDEAYFATMLDNELAAMGMGSTSAMCAEATSNTSAPHPSTTTADDELASEAQREQRLMEAALKGRRDMTEEEVRVLHELIAASNRISTKVLIEVLRQRHLCIGVPRAEVERTVRRYYERKHGFLLRRPQPWEVTDERLFARMMKREGGTACDIATATLTDYIAKHTPHTKAEEEVNEEAEETTVQHGAEKATAEDNVIAVDEESNADCSTRALVVMTPVVDDDGAIARKRPRSEADEVVCCEPNTAVTTAAEATNSSLPHVTSAFDGGTKDEECEPRGVGVV